jgi:hypothetical protein
MILVWSILICFSIASFNAFGVAVTKNASSAQRSTIDTSRTVLIWVVQLATGAEIFDPLQLVGFIFLVAGTLVYNEIVIIPWMGFDKNTKIARAKREKEEKMGGSSRHTSDDNNTYQAVSPHAAYDASRNKRKVQEKMEEIQRSRLEGGLNKSELTTDDNYRVNPSGTVKNPYED